MKRILIMLCMLSLTFSFTACSKNTENDGEKEKIESEESDVDDREEYGAIVETKENAEKEEGKEEDTNSSSALNIDTTKEQKTPSSYGISKDDAMRLIEDKYGANGHTDESTGNEVSYVYEDVQQIGNIEYYNFRHSWIIYNDEGVADHISQLGNIFVSTDGSTVNVAEQTEDGWRLCIDESNVLLTFLMDGYDNKESSAILMLNDDGTFSFSYDVLSSYLPYGKFELTKEKLICKTIDDMYLYTFDVVDDYTVKFNASESSEIEMIDTTFAKPKDGSIFRIIDEATTE